MMQVKALRPHTNAFGAKAQKDRGDIYTIDDPKAAQHLIGMRMVAEAKPRKKADEGQD